MAIDWPKRIRKLARDGHEADAVIVSFRSVDGDGMPVSQPVVRIAFPDGSERIYSNGLSAGSHEQRGRGDLMRVIVSLSDDLAFALAEPGPFQDAAVRLRTVTGSWSPVAIAKALRSTSVEWGRRVEATVVGFEQQPGGTRTWLRFEGRDELVGPLIAAPDPRRFGDLVDIGLDPAGAVMRPTFGPGPGSAEFRREVATEPGLLRKIWNSELLPF